MKTENYYSSNEILKGNGVKGKVMTKGIGTKIMMYIVLVFAFLFVGVFSNGQKTEATDSIVTIFMRHMTDGFRGSPRWNVTNIVADRLGNSVLWLNCSFFIFK